MKSKLALVVKISLTLLFTHQFLFANDSLDNYRINGIDNLAKIMDEELTKVSYWSEYIKERDTRFGFTEEYSSILTCDKEKSTLALYVKNKDNQYEFVKEHSAFTGKNNGDKTEEGDLRTPVGIYRIVDKLSKETKLDSFYGPLAFVTSYPNIYDRYKGKNGHGIWIHGLPSEQERDSFTKGCIAIGNDNIECLGNKINYQETLLIIDNKKVSENPSKELLASLLSELFKWRYAWIYSDTNSYLDFYTSDFVRDDGMQYEEFKNYKTRVFQKDEKKTIIFQNISVIPYPNNENIFKITFKEHYRSDTFRFSGNKALMVKFVDNKMKIFAEQ
ncbi:MAG: L,D-transpeptidase family protein [Sulfurimonas sp.]|nr:L,D-transpeptidase family protein [Sulfurimonas sp.]